MYYCILYMCIYVSVCVCLMCRCTWVICKVCVCCMLYVYVLCVCCMYGCTYDFYNVGQLTCTTSPEITAQACAFGAHMAVGAVKAAIAPSGFPEPSTRAAPAHVHVMAVTWSIFLQIHVFPLHPFSNFRILRSGGGSLCEYTPRYIEFYEWIKT